MKKLKFRVWNGYEMLSIPIKGTPKDIKAIDWDLLFESSREEKVMQFIGLCSDIKKQDIYEGDIVEGIVRFPQLLTGDTEENSSFKMCGIVYWDHSGFSLKCIQSKCDPKRDGMCNYFNFVGSYGEVFDEMKVVGNIYENPELLK